MIFAMNRRLTLAGTVSAFASSIAVAQITPDRTYYGINRAMPMTIAQPDGVEGDLSVALLDADTSNVTVTADVLEGSVDLAGLFPSLWEQADTSVQYAQLFAGETRVGSAVVLQPMLLPRYANIISQDGSPAWGALSNVFSGIRAYSEKHVVFETDKGTIEFQMRPDHAPNTVWNFMNLAEGGFYTDILFHRISPESNTQTNGPQPFVVQAGDPLGTGSGGPGYFIDLEPSQLPHDFGVLSMARSPRRPNSNGSQIFICLSRLGTARLDGDYTSFGAAVSGADVIVTISQVPLTGPGSSTPVEPPVIKRAYLVDAPPRGEAPSPVKRPGTDTPR